MRNDKVIRGRPEYYYRGSRYLEMPDNTIVKRVVYNEKDNVSRVYCGKRSKIIEVACALIIVGCIGVNRLYLHHLDYNIHYTSLCYYYSGSLYLNIVNDSGNTSDLTVNIMDGEEVLYSGVLEPGESLISIPIDNVKSSYTVIFSVKTFITTRTEEVTVRVVSKGVN